MTVVETLLAVEVQVVQADQVDLQVVEVVDTGQLVILTRLVKEFTSGMVQATKLTRLIRIKVEYQTLILQRVILIRGAQHRKHLQHRKLYVQKCIDKRSLRIGQRP